MEKELLRRVQLAQLEIAKELKRVCDENGIRYFMDSGTLLGAVRHKGFIPWDDDMDFGMMRDEYERFLKIAPEKLSDEYFLQTWESDPYYGMPFAKLRKKGTRYVERNSERSKAHNELFIDIFPYNSYPDSEEDRKQQGFEIKKDFTSLLGLSGATPWLQYQNPVKRASSRLKFLGVTLYGKLAGRENLIRKYTEAATRFNGQMTKNVFEEGGSAAYDSWVVSRKCFDAYQTLLFEGVEFSAPADADTYLRDVYGDYMQLPPVKERENRHQVLEVKL